MNDETFKKLFEYLVKEFPDLDFGSDYKHLSSIGSIFITFFLIGCFNKMFSIYSEILKSRKENDKNDR